MVVQLENKKLINSKTNLNWLIIIDKKNTDTSQLYKPVKKYIRKSNSKKPNSKNPNSKKTNSKKTNSKNNIK